VVVDQIIVASEYALQSLLPISLHQRCTAQSNLLKQQELFFRSICIDHSKRPSSNSST